jgi:uncharacterized membrane protein YtjA (UPF0391 family)
VDAAWSALAATLISCSVAAGKDEQQRGPRKGAGMTLLKWALICLLISLVAGAFGYTGLARGAGQFAKLLFFIFLIIFIIILILAISAGQLVF